jgi:transposase
LVEVERYASGRNLETTFVIIDSKSIKNTDTAESKGYDAGKKVSGIKLHMAVDILGLPHAIHMTKANVTDRNGAIEMVLFNLDNLVKVQNMLFDSGYSGENFANAIKQIHGSSVEVVKKSDFGEFQVIPKRWIVERTFAWLEKNRRLWKNCERKLHTSMQMTVLALLTLILKRF